MISNQKRENLFVLLGEEENVASELYIFMANRNKRSIVIDYSHKRELESLSVGHVFELDPEGLEETKKLFYTKAGETYTIKSSEFTFVTFDPDYNHYYT